MLKFRPQDYPGRALLWGARFDRAGLRRTDLSRVGR